MRTLTIALLLGLAACGANESEITLTVDHVSMAEVESIRKELSTLRGVYDVKAGAFKDSLVTFTLKVAGKGSDLASRLATLPSGLKNVKSFDDQSVVVTYAGLA
ncbi:MAG: hypothetical protein JO332_15475, partial [Planctomycetaceae bacterium]|nr:hypothetical protein [Planctomycetaceae bacterium]